MCSCAEYRFSAHSTWLCVSKGSIKLFHTIQPSDTNFSANERTTTKTNACLPFFLASFFVTWTWTCCSKWTNTSWCFGNVQLSRTVVWPRCFFALSWSLAFCVGSFCGASVEHENWLHYECVSVKLCAMRDVITMIHSWMQLVCATLQCCSWNALTNFVARTKKSN